MHYLQYWNSINVNDKDGETTVSKMHLIKLSHCNSTLPPIKSVMQKGHPTLPGRKSRKRVLHVYKML